MGTTVGHLLYEVQQRLCKGAWIAGDNVYLGLKQTQCLQLIRQGQGLSGPETDGVFSQYVRDNVCLGLKQTQFSINRSGTMSVWA